MEALSETNLIQLCGRIGGRPAYSHTSRGVDFYTLPLHVRRLSGAEDRLNLLLRKEQMEQTALGEGEKLQVKGELRSFNNRSGKGPRLVLSVFVRELGFCTQEESNRVRLRGSLCREPRLRRTPLGREIADLLLAVPRSYGRTDYLPCICWGALARRAAAWETGERLALEGRFQSREYLKMTEEGLIRRTAYEVSAMEIEEEPSGTSFVERLDWNW